MLTDAEIAELRAEMQVMINREKIDVLGEPCSAALKAFRARVVTGNLTPEDISRYGEYGNESEAPSSPLVVTTRYEAA